MSLSFTVETPEEFSREWNPDFKDLMGVICHLKSKTHVLSLAFHEAKTKVQTNSFAFGFLLGNIMQNFEFHNLFEDLAHSG